MCRDYTINAHSHNRKQRAGESGESLSYWRKNRIATKKGPSYIVPLCGLYVLRRIAGAQCALGDGKQVTWAIHPFSLHEEEGLAYWTFVVLTYAAEPCLLGHRTAASYLSIFHAASWPQKSQ
jgi:hypothetical protein